MKREGVLIVGSANMDMVVSTQNFPHPGETVFGSKFEMFPGGKGANQAVSCAKLGAATYFIGKMGQDDFKEKLLEKMTLDGVRLEHLLIDEDEHTGMALITVDGEGENEIVVVSGSNMNLTVGDIVGKRTLFSKVDVVLTQLEIPLDTVIETGRLAKVNKNMFILNPAPAQNLPDELFNIVDFLTPNETELEILSGIKIINDDSVIEGANKLLDKGVKNVIVTMGKKGAILINNDGAETFHTQKVVVVDTTGAGDAFNGALAFSLSQGDDIKRAIDFANIVASFSVTRMGAQSSMPTIEEIKEITQY
jgi:ribokinase